ncbi:NAD+ synthase [Pseudohongiella nitratireducens]|uniref:Glutamine-dependent NAD(+) synthetase n=1 Tax=Pseudohongiella nitratireducens TaxID=1768907 RepID=A0A916VKE4_9GAMM|nr:NAD+ synthase [Pseudohongiella nitratireducens]GFZ81491.1 NAD+ synthase [Pseudohongiella nitratireducens]
MNQLNVVMAQLNFLVGDIPGNTQRIIETAQQAITEHEAHLVIYPELSLTAYPPEDLLLRPALCKRVERALQQICDANLPGCLVVGFPHSEGELLYNALAVIDHGKLIARYRKQCLPNYQVFDERRYFSEGEEPCVVSLFGSQVAFTICEDLWHEEPMRQAAEAGAQLMVNINASPFHTDKLEQRIALLENRAKAHAIPILYVNQVGGQDELVFDGYSMVADANGQVSVPGAGFAEAMVPVTLSLVGQGQFAVQSQHETGKELATRLSLEKRCYDAMVLGLRDYVHKNGFKDVMLGLSGGIDSGLTLAIAVDALGAEHVTAVMMPYRYTSDLSLSLAAEQAKRLGTRYEILPINKAYESFAEILEAPFAGKAVDLTEQNIQARCRGILLMALSNKFGALVLSTGNKSEVAVGYCTLYGDMAGAFNVLKDASKTLVYQLARYRNNVAAEAGEADAIPEQVITRPPSAELAPGQKDEDSLPPYDRLDQIISLYVEQDYSTADIVKAGYDKDEVGKVARLIDINEYKRRQASPGVRLTLRAFGRDRRYPITQGWKSEVV